VSGEGEGSSNNQHPVAAERWLVFDWVPRPGGHDARAGGGGEAWPGRGGGVMPERGGGRGKTTAAFTKFAQKLVWLMLATWYVVTSWSG
jgi:hypothetical protein